MTQSTPTIVTSDAAGTQRAVNPWLFVPFLYFMQFVPNGLVTSLFAPIYKSLGVDNVRIATWTGLASLPWVFKMFWAPLVDLNSTKRNWTIGMQFLLTACFAATAVVMGTPQFFVLTVAAMFVMATLSATHDIACDGLYLMSLDRQRQAAFSGVMAASSRLARLFIDSGLVFLAGWLTTHASVGQQTAWIYALGLCSLVYGCMALWNYFHLPRPAADVPVAHVDPRETSRNIRRTLTIVAAGVVAYYFVNSALQLLGGAISASVPAGKVPKSWALSHSDQVALWMKLVICGIALPMLWVIIKTQVRGTPMGDAFISYVRQPRFSAILSFIIFYRFGEAMIFAMSSLFILDKRSAGGMGISLEQLGLIKGGAQVIGLLVGGLLGGWFISRVGLRKAFWPLVVCMHLPNVLYIWAAMQLPKPNWLYPVVFFEAFGYGVGFAGYFVYLMQVAQRNKFVTSHYAIGTGLGALFIAFATILAGIVQSVFGYVGVFIAACLFTIPGTLTLLIIPLDKHEPGIAAAPTAGH